MNSTDIKAHCLMTLTMFLAATSFPVGSSIANELSPVVLMFARFTLAALLFCPYVFYKNGFKLPPVKRLVSYAFLSIPLTVFFWCMFESLRHTSVLNTGALFTLVPAITAIFTFLINKESSTIFRSFGLGLGTIGALWIVFKGDFNAFIGLDLNYGDLIFIVGCIFMGIYNPLIKKVYNGEPMEVMTFWVLVFGGFWLLLVSGGNVFDVDWSIVPQKVFIGIFYLSLFCTLITFLLLQWSVVKIGATKVAAYGFLTPLFVIIISTIIGISEVDVALYPGILLVIIAMFIIQKEPSS